MACRALLPLGIFGIVAALLLTFLSSRPHVTAPYTSYLVREVVDGYASPWVYTDLAFGSQSFKVLLDTGSSDAWLVLSDFTCFINHKAHPKADCNVGPLYHIDDDLTEIPGEIFHVRYSPMVAAGFPGKVPITLAGLTTTAEVGVVNRLSDPDLDIAPFASGLLGLAFSPLTNDYPAGTSATHKDLIPSKSIITTIFENTKLAHKFSLAVSRGETNLTDGGTFTLGDLPDLADPRINVTSDFASTNLEAAIDQDKELVSVGTPVLGWYTFTVEGLYYGTLGNVTVNTSPAQYILDTGEQDIQLPPADFERWLSMFDPPVPHNETTFNCNTTIPALEFRIGGKLFPMNPLDLVGRVDSNGHCSLRVSPGQKGHPYFLGDAFHRSVLAVYDWENEQMHFASRPYYKS